MKNYRFIENVKDDDRLIFRKVIRKLLDSTFILEAKDEKLYEFVSKESNQYDIEMYLNVMGYSLLVRDELKVAMLMQMDNEEAVAGLKRSNLLRFNKEQIQLLLVLWQSYLEKIGYSEKVFISVGELIDKLKMYGIEMKSDSKKSMFKENLKLMKKYSLIDYSEDESSEDASIVLYPSLQFCMDINQFKQVVKELSENNLNEVQDDDMEELEDEE